MTETRQKQNGKEGELIAIHALIVATSPFTTVIFNDKDKLDATLDQINNNTYDRLKICRSTLTIDGYLPTLKGKGIGAVVTYTGAFIFPLMQGINKLTVIGSVNNILLRLMFGGIDFNSVAPEDVGFGTVYGTGYYLAAGGASGASFSLLMALQHQSVSNFDTIQLMEPRTYTKAEFLAAIVSGSAVVERLPELNPSMFLDGITHYKKLQLASALVFLWTTAETLMSKIWLETIVPKGKGITGRKEFIKSNVWQSAFKAEVLFQSDIISSALYAKINEARSARNDLSHKGETPSLLACERALEVTFALISLVITDRNKEDKFSSLVSGLQSVHQQHRKPLEPKFWREIPSVPGDEKWGDKPYSRYPQIELVPLSDIKTRHLGRDDGKPEPSSKT